MRIKRLFTTTLGTVAVLCATLTVKTQAVNPILPLDEYIPDVEAQVFTNAEGEERVYLYGSHDNLHSSTWCSYQYRVYSAPVDDLEHWTDHGVSFASRPGEGYIWNGEDTDGVSWSDSQLYAPDVEYAEGKYWLVSCMAGGGLGMSVSDTPEGPFSPATKICYDDTGAHLGSIDPSIFYDNGTMYLVWGQTTAFGAEGCVGVVLEKDDNGIFSVAKSETKAYLFDNEGYNSDGFGFYEGPSLGKLDNGSYYIYYPSGNGTETHSMAYATADEPLGEYTYRGIIIDPAGTDKVADNCHGSLCKINGQWYAFYHRGVNGSYTRRVCVEPITVQEDGTIEQVEVSSRGFSGPLNPYEKVEAAYASRVWMPGSARSCYLEEESKDLHFLTNLNENDCVEYKDFDFGTQEEQLQFTAKVRSKAGGSIDLILDDPDAAPVGTLVIPAGGHGAWEELSGVVQPVSGVHTLYLRFHSESGDRIGDVASFQFEPLVPLFEDDFASGLDAWEHTEQAEIVDGKLFLSGNESMAARSESGWKNYVLQAEVTRDEGPAGIAFRRVGAGYEYLFTLSEDKAAFGVQLDGEYRELASVAAQFPSGEPYQVQIECAGSELRAYVGGELILKAEDDTLTAGGIGFVQPEGTSAYFDNVSVIETPVLRVDRILVNGQPLEGFNAGQQVYTLKVKPDGALPVVQASSTDPEVNVEVTQAAAIPGEATVAFSKDGAETLYTIRFRESLKSRNDMFDGETYSDAWEILNPNPEKVSYVQNEGLRLQADFGEIGEDPQTENVFLQTAEGNWSMETKITFNNASGYGQAGLTVYSSKTDYIKFTRMANGVVEGRNYNNGQMDQFLYQGGVTLTDNTLWLRARKFGNEYTFSYSTNGVDYVDARTTVFDAENPQIGLVANGSNVGGSVDATFHYFKFVDESLQSDEFDGESYSSAWHILNPNPELVTYAGDGLRIQSSSGEIESDPQAENIFLQSGDGDWMVETQMYFNGKSGYGQAGLTVYESPSDFIKFVYLASGTVEGKLYQDGVMQDQFMYQSVGLENETLWLRAEKTGNQYRFSYSTDGVSYQEADEVTLEADHVLVGLVANGSNAGGNVDVTFQYFKAQKIETFLPDVIPVESVEFETPALSVDVGGLGLLRVAVSPEDASYRDITWEIVDGDGIVQLESDTHGSAMVIRGISSGTATISATVGGKTASCTVQVEGQEPAGKDLSVAVSGADTVKQDQRVPYTFSFSGEKENLGNVTVVFNIKGDQEGLFTGGAFEAAEGFSQYVLDEEEQADGSRRVKVVLAYGMDELTALEEAALTGELTDLFTYVIRSSAEQEGNIEVTVEQAIFTYAGDNDLYYADVTGATASTSVSAKDPYDIDGDGDFDQADITAAQGYYRAAEGDENWDEARKADVNRDGVVDLTDLVELATAWLDTL